MKIDTTEVSSQITKPYLSITESITNMALLVCYSIYKQSSLNNIGQKMRCIQLFWILICVCYVNSQEPRVDPLVNTEQGFIRGEKSVDGTYSMFLGIPYARVFVENPFGVSSKFSSL